MLYMILIKASKRSEEGIMPSNLLMQQMDDYNDELLQAGIRVIAKGLHPTSKGKRITFINGDKTYFDGPFEPVEDQLAGFFLIDVKDEEEANAWFNKVPDPIGHNQGSIELRQVF